jgi:RNA polymerase sporulation-specific sigma factor
MNEEQLFLDNEGLVYDFLKKKFINFNERDDILQHLRIGLLYAIRTYKPDLGFKLSTYAWRCISNEYKRYHEQKNMAKRKANNDTDSLNALAFREDEETEFVNTLKSDANTEDEAILNITIDQLTESEQQWLITFQNRQYGELCEGISRQAVSKRRKKLIQKIVG